jgi:hypothetical protein
MEKACNFKTARAGQIARAQISTAAPATAPNDNAKERRTLRKSMAPAVCAAITFGRNWWEIEVPSERMPMVTVE